MMNEVDIQFALILPLVTCNGRIERGFVVTMANCSIRIQTYVKLGTGPSNQGLEVWKTFTNRRIIDMVNRVGRIPISGCHVAGVVRTLSRREGGLSNSFEEIISFFISSVLMA